MSKGPSAYSFDPIFFFKMGLFLLDAVRIRATRYSKAEIVNFQNITISKPVEYSTPLYDTVKAILCQKITFWETLISNFEENLVNFSMDFKFFYFLIYEIFWYDFLFLWKLRLHTFGLATKRQHNSNKKNKNGMGFFTPQTCRQGISFGLFLSD